MKLTTVYCVSYKSGERRYCRSLSAAVRAARHALHSDSFVTVTFLRTARSAAHNLQKGPECATTPNETC